MSHPLSDGDSFAPSHSDESGTRRLVGLAKEGDQAAFEQLWNIWHESLWRSLVHLLANEEDARALTQDTFIKAWRNLHHLRDLAAFPAWLYSIARNEAYTLLRERQRHQVVTLAENEGSYQEQYTVPGPEDTVVELMVLQQAFSTLCLPFREALHLSVVEGLSKREIAQTMGISEASVYSYVSRGRKQLRQAYQDILAEKGNHPQEGGAGQ